MAIGQHGGEQQLQQIGLPDNDFADFGPNGVGAGRETGKVGARRKGGLGRGGSRASNLPSGIEASRAASNKLISAERASNGRSLGMEFVTVAP